MSTNLLSRETSPYLLQHKDNPVHWMAWGPAAFARARAEDRPVLLSVGYAACHWCHVMAHESFEDQATADLMNTRFINIKVDREERPDVDRIYMQSLHLLGEHGGWPLTMFLTPDAEPFWGGTYFPKESRYGRPSFTHVLTEISRIWTQERNKITKNSAALVRALGASREPAAPAGELTEQSLDRAARALLDAVDLHDGGLEGAPKFPQAPLFGFLWTMARRTGNPALAEAVATTLRHICQGGIYDHLGGGIARYSTDHRWLVPHFEKMLYDNAQLIALLSRVWLGRRDPLFRIRIEETIRFLLRDMRVPSRTFAASYDADSEGEEGRYYVWSATEISEVLPPDLREPFMTTYDVTESGNWEGVNILNRLGHPDLLDEASEARLAAARDILLRRRLTRVPPGFDDKVLADWNGLAIQALAEAALVLAHRDWAEAAATAFAALMKDLWTGGRLWHSWRHGDARHHATADGYANLIAAALALSPLFREGDHLAWAHTLLEAMILHHWDDAQGAFCLSADDATMIIARPAHGEDDVTPNANAVMVRNLAMLHHLTGEPGHLARAETILSTFTSRVLANPFGYPSLMSAFAFLTDAVQLVITGEDRDPFTDSAFRVAVETVAPDCVIQWVAAGAQLPEGHPASGKQVSGEDRVYICRGQVCAAPAANPGQVRDALSLLGLSRA
jgi:uncharacterized protein YyaL (SSP411 family)